MMQHCTDPAGTNVVFTTSQQCIQPTADWSTKKLQMTTLINSHCGSAGDCARRNTSKKFQLKCKHFLLTSLFLNSFFFSWTPKEDERENSKGNTGHNGQRQCKCLCPNASMKQSMNANGLCITQSQRLCSTQKLSH